MYMIFSKRAALEQVAKDADSEYKTNNLIGSGFKQDYWNHIVNAIVNAIPYEIKTHHDAANVLRAYYGKSKKWEPGVEQLKRMRLALDVLPPRAVPTSSASSELEEKEARDTIHRIADALGCGEDEEAVMEHLKSVIEIANRKTLEWIDAAPAHTGDVMVEPLSEDSYWDARSVVGSTLPDSTEHRVAAELLRRCPAPKEMTTWRDAYEGSALVSVSTGDVLTAEEREYTERARLAGHAPKAVAIIDRLAPKPVEKTARELGEILKAYDLGIDCPAIVDELVRRAEKNERNGT